MNDFAGPHWRRGDLAVRDPPAADAHQLEAVAEQPDPELVVLGREKRDVEAAERPHDLGAQQRDGRDELIVLGYRVG